MFPVTDDQKALVDAVRDFAEQRVAPHALDWDAEKHFPVDVLAEAGELGLGGIYVRGRSTAAPAWSARTRS